MKQERIQKIIARAGLASRRKAEQFLVDKRVKVNGKTVSLGDSADPTADRIEIEGIGVIKPEPVVYIAMHKPANVVCTMKDPEGRITVNHILSLREQQVSGCTKAICPAFTRSGNLITTPKGSYFLPTMESWPIVWAIRGITRRRRTR